MLFEISRLTWILFINRPIAWIGCNVLADALEIVFIPDDVVVEARLPREMFVIVSAGPRRHRSRMF